MTSSSVLSFPSSSLSQNRIHDVFPSFHGADVRKKFLSHLLENFRSKAIGLFIDNEIRRGESIGPKLEEAIRGSKIAVVLLSKGYASSSWCLDELVNIMECREVLDQKVITIFYEVDPSDIKKQTRGFGKAFKKTCQGKTGEKIETWIKALEAVATIAGYHLRNWDNEAAMIEKITTDILTMLYHLTPSCDFERYIGMGAHIEKMKPLLRMDLDEVRMIGIWGPPGIGKTTIARFMFNKFSNSFQLKANMEKIKECYSRPHEHNTQLQLQNQMLSQMLNKKDMVITHLRTAQERLNDKKVLLVLDDVDHVEQLDALAKEIEWFGSGSRIIITTQDLRVLRAHGIKDIYTVDLPSDHKALKIFCMSAFGQKYPKDGFRNLSWEVVCHAGKLPLGLTVMGSYFRNMSKQEWRNALPKLWSSLDGEIESILKFSYDALDYDDKYLFRLIACFFVDEEIEHVKEYLAKRFPYVIGLDVLADKSLISIQFGKIRMHDLLVKLGREIVRKQSENPGQREFLVDSGEISEILEDDDGAGSEKVIGIKFNCKESELNISEGAFEKMPNLQFLKIEGYSLHLQHLTYLPSKLRLLHWHSSPITCLPSNFTMKFLVELNMTESKLKKLSKGIKRLPNLKWIYLSGSKNLKELPDLSTATNLQELDLEGCSSLVKLPSFGNATNLQKMKLNGCSSLVELHSSIGNATNLQELDLAGCSSLVKLPSIGNATNLQEMKLNGCSSLVELHSSIGNATNLQELDLNGCSSLVELPVSIGNLHQLKGLEMQGCSKLKVLPVNVNLKSLDILDLSDCSSLTSFPEISTNIRYLYLNRTAIEKVPSSIRSWSSLERLDMYDCKNLKEFPHALDSITEPDTKIQEVQGFSSRLVGCKELLSLQQLPESLHELDCSTLEVSPVNVNLKSLDELHLRGCSSLKRFPEISTTIRDLDIGGTAIEEVPSSIWSWSRLDELHMSRCKNLKKFAPALDSITVCDTKIQEISPLVQGFPSLLRLVLNGCKELLSLPKLPDSLEQLDADNCESLERLDCSLRSPYIHFNFPNCFKLNKEARDLIIQKSARGVSVLPGEEIPTYFTYRANGGSVIVKLNERPFPMSSKFKACILLVSKKNDDVEAGNGHVECKVMDKQSSLDLWCSVGRLLTEHLYIFKLEADVTSNELLFEFILSPRTKNDWMIKECGIVEE